MTSRKPFQSMWMPNEAVYDNPFAAASQLLAMSPSEASRGWPPIIVGTVQVVRQAVEQITRDVRLHFRGVIMREDGPQISDALVVAADRASHYLGAVTECVWSNIENAQPFLDRLQEFDRDQLIVWPETKALHELSLSDLLEAGVDREAADHAIPSELVWSMIELHDAICYLIEATVRGWNGAITWKDSGDRQWRHVVRASRAAVEFAARSREHMSLAVFRRERRHIVNEETGAVLRRVSWSLRSKQNARVNPSRRSR
jgi:hypothetical protein